MNATIAQVHEEDVAQVRDLLRATITEAGEAWLPMNAVIDALMLELIELSSRHRKLGNIAAKLNQIAALVEHAQTDTH